MFSKRKTKRGARHRRGKRTKPERRLQRYINKTADREVRREAVRANMKVEREANEAKAAAKATRDG